MYYRNKCVGYFGGGISLGGVSTAGANLGGITGKWKLEGSRSSWMRKHLNIQTE